MSLCLINNLFHDEQFSVLFTVAVAFRKPIIHSQITHQFFIIEKKKKRK